jgi:hypothetical protein
MTATTSTVGRDTAAEASMWGSLDIALDLNDVHLGGAILDGAITMGGGGRSTVSGRATSVEQARELFISTNTAAPPPPVPNSQSAASPSAVRGGGQRWKRPAQGGGSLGRAAMVQHTKPRRGCEVGNGGKLVGRARCTSRPAAAAAAAANAGERAGRLRRVVRRSHHVDRAGAPALRLYKRHPARAFAGGGAPALLGDESDKSEEC